MLSDLVMVALIVAAGLLFGGLIWACDRLSR
jgi:hypothetical protein